MKFKVLKGTHAVTPFVATVRTHADSERAALGFIPEAAYPQAAASGKLLIAVLESDDSLTFAGHLLFGGIFPNIRVFQIYVVPMHRRHRVASLLIQTLIKDSEDQGYLSISAKVASDLIDANAFWQREGFSILRSKPGGISRGRTLNIRVRDLDTPRLFGTVSNEGLTRTNRLPPINTATVPTYIIDVNVFLDLMKGRSNAEEARRLIAASLTRAVDVFVSEEFVEELRRARNSSEADPVLEFASALPRLPRIPKAVIEPMVAELAVIVFPEKAKRNSLSPNDTSDLIHIATAIHHRVSGFVTGEKALLRRAPELRSRFRIDLVGTVEFSNRVAPAEHETVGSSRVGSRGDELAVSELQEEHRVSVDVFLKSIDVPPPIIVRALSSGAHPLNRRRIGVRSTLSGQFIGYASWDATTRIKPRTEAYVFVSETHPDTRAIAAHLFEEIARAVSLNGPCVILLKNSEGNTTVREMAVDAGFRAHGAGATGTNFVEVQKIIIGGGVTLSNLSAVNTILESMTGLRLSEQMPTYNGPETPINVLGMEGVSVELPLVEAEKVLGTILLLPGRCGTLVPIRRQHADHLFCGAQQLSLLPRKQAALYSERTYFRSPGRAALFGIGSPVVFYESLATGGRGCAFSSAIVATCRDVWAQTLSDRVLLKGVLERENIVEMSKNGLVSMLNFDNVIAFKRTVGLSRLRAIKAVDGANLVGPRRLDSDTLAALFAEADALAM